MRTAHLSATNSLVFAFLGGVTIGSLGGLIGLGGAEFRLPLLIGLFGFAALQAIVLNKAMSLIVVVSALLFRSSAIPSSEVLSHWTIVAFNRAFKDKFAMTPTEYREQQKAVKLPTA